MSNDHKLLKPVGATKTVCKNIKGNKIVPILEMPSSESERSNSFVGLEPYSARMRANGPTAAVSARSQDSYGF